MVFSRSVFSAGVLAASLLLHASAHAAPKPFDAGIYSSASATFNADAQIISPVIDHRVDQRIFVRSPSLRKRWNSAPASGLWMDDSIVHRG